MGIIAYCLPYYCPTERLKPGTAMSDRSVEEQIHKIQSKLRCPKCKKGHAEPKLLPCFHIFCKPCLEDLVVQGPEEQSLTCPSCRHLVTLPDNGVDGLQTDFQNERLLQELELLIKSKDPICGSCQPERQKAVKYCKQCSSFVCNECIQIHQKMKALKEHNLLDIENVRANATKVLIPEKPALKCKHHPEMDARLYCQSCSVVMCQDCIIRYHRDHDYDLVTAVFPTHKEELECSLEPLHQKLKQVKRTLGTFDITDQQIDDQKATKESEIREKIGQLHKLLDRREKELIDILNEQAQQKKDNLAAQRDQVEMTRATMDSCLEYAEAGLETGTEGEVLRMKGPVLKRIEEITAEYDPRNHEPLNEADIEVVTANEAHTREAIEIFGAILSDPIDANQTYTTGEGTKFAIVRQLASVEVHPITRNGKECTHNFQLASKVIHTETGEPFYCQISRENGRHTINFKLSNRGKHNLHITVNGQHIQGSPYPIAVVPPLDNLLKPFKKIRGRNEPHSVVENSQRQLVISSHNEHRITVLEPEGKEVCTFGCKGWKKGLIDRPCGVAVDEEDNIYVVDNTNYRIQKFNTNGTFVKAAGLRGGNQGLYFDHPVGICFNRTDNLLYVCDQLNHRIQVLTTDLTFVRSFGRAGDINGQFNFPFNLIFDSSNNLYVTDRDNNRVQVFTAEGQFLRAFSAKANGELLEKPNAIAISSSNVLYVSEEDRHCVSLFTTQGDFITTFGGFGKEDGQFIGVYGLYVNHNDSIIVADYHNQRLQLFS